MEGDRKYKPIGSRGFMQDCAENDDVWLRSPDQRFYQTAWPDGL
jgi:hypothetical protein